MSLSTNCNKQTLRMTCLHTIRRISNFPTMGIHMRHSRKFVQFLIRMGTSMIYIQRKVIYDIIFYLLQFHDNMDMLDVTVLFSEVVCFGRTVETERFRWMLLEFLDKFGGNSAWSPVLRCFRIDDLIEHFYFGLEMMMFAAPILDKIRSNCKYDPELNGITIEFSE